MQTANGLVFQEKTDNELLQRVIFHKLGKGGYRLMFFNYGRREK